MIQIVNDTAWRLNEVQGCTDSAESCNGKLHEVCNKRILILVFIDLYKAYDKVSRKLLLVLLNTEG